MDLKKMYKYLFLILILSFSSCDAFHLTHPYYLDGNIAVFFDGKMVGTFFDDRVDGSSVGLDADINISVGVGTEEKPDLYDEFIVYHRLLDWDEISFLYDNPGNLPADTSDLAGYYQFEGDVNSNPLAPGPDGIPSEPTVLLEYETGGVDGNALHVSSSDGSQGNLLFDSTILPQQMRNMTVSIWIKAEALHTAGFLSILNCWGGDAHDDYFNMDIERGFISNTTHELADYDPDSWHMITFLIEG